MRPDPGATTVDMVDYIKPKLLRNPMNIILHCSTDDITDGVNNPLKKIGNLLKKLKNSIKITIRIPLTWPFLVLLKVNNIKEKL